MNPDPPFLSVWHLTYYQVGASGATASPFGDAARVARDLPIMGWLAPPQSRGKRNGGAVSLCWVHLQCLVDDPSQVSRYVREVGPPVGEIAVKCHLRQVPPSGIILIVVERIAVHHAVQG